RICRSHIGHTAISLVWRSKCDLQPPVRAASEPPHADLWPLPKGDPLMPPTAERLLDKWAIEDRTSLDISTIYRKIKAGTFPAPVRIGLRRVAWRESDIVKWQQNLVQGVAFLSYLPGCRGRERGRGK